MKKFICKILEEIEDAPYKHPYFPLVIAIIALVVSIVMPLLRSALA